jgi:hypothetical protein
VDLPLIMVVEEEDIEMVRMLVEAGADVNLERPPSQYVCKYINCTFGRSGVSRADRGREAALRPRRRSSCRSTCHRVNTFCGRNGTR